MWGALMLEPGWIYVNIFALFVLVLILVNLLKTVRRILFLNNLYILIVILNITLIIVDILGWAFNTLPGQINYTLNALFNLILYVIAPLGGILWFLYVDFYVYRNIKRHSRIMKWMLLLFLLNTLISVISVFFTGWFFKIKEGNVYERGEFFLVHIAICYAFFFYVFFFTVKNRSRIEKRIYVPLLLFPLPPVIGGILQSIFYGTSLNWSGMALSVLIIYFNIQNENLNTDYLTNVYNRRQFDQYVIGKIQSSSESRSFSVILIDLDQFKSINDTYGHATGDEVLQTAAALLRQCLRKNDFIARYGGDEFCVVLDIDNKKELEEIVGRINLFFERFNRNYKKSYEINLSMGYDVYDTRLNQDYETFLKHVDKRMYEAKKVKSNRIKGKNVVC